MSEVDIRKCPNCGAELEEGFVHCPRTLDWKGKKLESIVPVFHWGVAKLQGWKCPKCQLIIFLYGKRK